MGLVSESKRCTICALKKPLNQFLNTPRGADGKRGECRDCRKGILKRTTYRNTMSNLKEQLENAPYEVAMVLLKRDTDLLLHVINCYPTEYKQLLKEKRTPILVRIQQKHEYYKERAARSAATRKARQLAKAS